MLFIMLSWKRVEDRPLINHTRINGLRRQFQLLKVVLKQLQKGIDNDIYSTVDACPNACEMWKAIERLKQGESINVQVLETNLYWEFGKFTSRDGESLKSYYSQFYKMMNELVRNQSYYKEKMLLCKQEEAGVQLNAEQADWKDDAPDDDV
ncbi:ribonuclease H-like domain-containing protein [Tanacetum coccineum]